MTYKINGTPLQLQPSTGQWGPRRALGVDGEGRAIYSPFYSFQMQWDAMTPDDFEQLYAFWQATSATGVVMIDLPKKGSSTLYEFDTYSGIIDEPQQGEYFQGHHLRIELLSRRIIV